MTTKRVVRSQKAEFRSQERCPLKVVQTEILRPAKKSAGSQDDNSGQWAVVGGGATAVEGDFGAGRAVARAGHEAPGVAIALEARAAARVVWIEVDLDAGSDSADRDYIPCARGHDIDHQEIDVVCGIRPARTPVACLDIIGTPGLSPGVRGLDLHTPESATGVEDEVVMLDVAGRFDDSESEFSGFVHEGEFGDVALTFAIRVFALSDLWEGRLGLRPWIG